MKPLELDGVDIWNLSSLPLSKAPLLPGSAGLYFVRCDDDHSLLYIGASRCIQKRVYLHNKKTEFERYGAISIAWILVKEETSLLSYERMCISRFKPLLNDGGPHPLRPGPVPKGRARYNMFLPPALGDWAKAHPEGLSGLIRRLLADERRRLESSP